MGKAEMTWNVINLLICSGIFCVCFERLTITTGKTRWPVRWTLSGLATMALASGVAPLFWPETRHIVTAAFAVTVALHMLSLGASWRGTPPRELHHGHERRAGRDRRGAGNRRR